MNLKTATIVLLSLATLFINSSAFAGATADSEVYIYSASTYAYATGGLESARFSDDSTQFIKCQVNQNSTGVYVFCQARNAAGTYLACSSTDWKHRVAVEAMNDASQIYFNKSGTNSTTCNTVRITNDSRYIK